MLAVIESKIHPLNATTCYVNSPVVSLKKEPKESSEVVSQVLCSEAVHIEEDRGDWVLVRTADGYSGWLLEDKLFHERPYQSNIQTAQLINPLYQKASFKEEPIELLPYGVGLHLIREEGEWAKVILSDQRQCYMKKACLSKPVLFTHKKQLAAFSQNFLKVPYVWGGRSSFGFDCSGFVQMLYSHLGVQLKRDAKDQILDARFQQVSDQKLSPGDLIFFGTTKDQIKHVGMHLKGDLFIHATSSENMPWVRISKLSDPMWNGSKSAEYHYRTNRSKPS